MGRKGWHKRGYLPHLDGHEITQHVVFRLADAVPSGSAYTGDDVLDRGFGEAILGAPECARIVCTTLLYFNNQRYSLRAWCVMPNYVHVLVTTSASYETGAVVRSWKSFSARGINAVLRRQGALWARDYFDRYMRDDDQFATSVRYIEANPVAAGLCEKPQDWPYSSAGWKD